MPRAVHRVRVQRGSLVRNAHVPGYLVCSQPFAMSRILEIGSTQYYYYFFSKRGQQSIWRTALPCKPKSLPCFHPSCHGWTAPGLQLSAVGEAVCGCALLHGARALLPGLPSQLLMLSGAKAHVLPPHPRCPSPPRGLALLGQSHPDLPPWLTVRTAPGGMAHFGADIPLSPPSLTLLLLT